MEHEHQNAEASLESFSGLLDVGQLFRNYRWRISFTWLLVLIENALLALIPLFIGRAIDALLAQQSGALWEISLVMGLLIVFAVARRIYDTRVYGTMRVSFSSELVRRMQDAPITQINARVEMSREMVDFLEGYVPALITGVIQVLVSMIILWSFDFKLGISSVAIIVGLILIYAMFHSRFFRLNQELNTQTERQVEILEKRHHVSLVTHLKRLRHFEVKLSDVDAILYGLIFAAMFAFVLVNLWFAAAIPAVTAGMIFAILSYSWELVESGTALPLTLQQWTRLSEIKQRLNETRPVEESS